MWTAKAEGDGDHEVCWQGGDAPSKPLYRMAQRLEMGKATMWGDMLGPGVSIVLSGAGRGDVPMGSVELPHLLPPQGSCGPVTQVFCAAVDEKKNPEENPVPIVTEL